jgi:FkbM family methyltransferase
MNAYRKIRNRIRQERRYKRRLARLAACGDFAISEIDGVKVAEGNGLSIGHLFNGDGISIFEDLFGTEDYYFDIGAQSVVIDLGMNIGLASLYFSARSDVDHVYGFEPFTPTYEQALFNFRLNQQYATKIHPNNYGLGDASRELTLDYYPRSPGRASTVKSIDEILPLRRYDTHRETVEIRNAADELRSIIDQHLDHRIIVKCDTEGAEKEIFESLDGAGLLRDIDMALIEFHFSCDGFLTDVLKKNDFSFFKQKTLTTSAGDFGIIRAVRR